MINNVKPHKMKNRLNSSDRVYVKSFPGATVEDMADYVRPTMKRSPDLIVLHAGTNNLRDEVPARTIADNVMKLALEMKNEANDVMVSGLIVRSDDENLNQKLLQVNKVLDEECKRYDLCFINHDNISATQHLNGGGLHLNYQGTSLLASNFIDHIKL